MLGSLLAALKSCSFGLIPGMIPTVLTGVFVFSYGAVVCFAPTLGDPHSYKSYFFLERTFKSSGSRISRNTLSFFPGDLDRGGFRRRDSGVHQNNLRILRLQPTMGMRTNSLGSGTIVTTSYNHSCLGCEDTQGLDFWYRGLGEIALNQMSRWDVGIHDIGMSCQI